uniref:Uncharacterized protein n=1 Tax=Globodera rostochiensis TaxID=31243 RepID=A0A914GP68_GLORO
MDGLGKTKVKSEPNKRMNGGYLNQGNGVGRHLLRNEIETRRHKKIEQNCTQRRNERITIYVTDWLAATGKWNFPE